ncbi:MAG: thiamine-phosphate pyrophosphorylase [Candidatus Omnitrophica bacterium]|nr:thiamine-phosphate pyrophosphorylase [Candidatus Omnitrophota bacterium]MCM8798825.1 thiamine-phosphate pyrophosphorylase [Candidatus Omnitrophota bacterium]
MRKKELLRILDANINRAKEGLRVCEDILRFWGNDKKLTRSCRGLRHKIDKILSDEPLFLKEKLLFCRDVKGDVGKNLKIEREKKNLRDLFLANMQRIEEGLRVLEEISKLFNPGLGEKFRELRFRTYHLEKKAFRLIRKYA